MHFRAYKRQKLKESTDSQTHFGFTDLGSKVHRFLLQPFTLTKCNVHFTRKDYGFGKVVVCLSITWNGAMDLQGVQNLKSVCYSLLAGDGCMMIVLMLLHWALNLCVKFLFEIEIKFTRFSKQLVVLQYHTCPCAVDM